MTTTLFTNAHIATGEPGSTATSTLPLQDILVTDGVFTAFGPGLAQQYEAQGGDLAAIEVVDLGGKLVCPPFCDTHLHCFASMFVRQVRQCFSAVWADGFPRCRHRFPVM